MSNDCAIPNDLIAQKPCYDRQNIRLMVVHRDTGEIEHRKFSDLLSYFEKDDVIILNDSKFTKTILRGFKAKSKIAITVHLVRELDLEDFVWDTVIEPARKVRIGNHLYFGNGELIAEILDNTTSRGRIMKFLFNDSKDKLLNAIDKLGSYYYPKYIVYDENDDFIEDYQCEFAKVPGSIIAPTEGIGIDEVMLTQFKIEGIKTIYMTAHLKKSYIKPLLNITKYVNNENYSFQRKIINNEVVDLVNNTQQSGHKVCAVGVQILKKLEANLNHNDSNYVCRMNKWINKLSENNNQFKNTCDMLLTNFQYFDSYQMLEARNFGGNELIKRAYSEAIKNKYNFLMYGDGLLII